LKDHHVATSADNTGTRALRPGAATRSRGAGVARQSTTRSSKYARADGTPISSITLRAMRSMVTASDAIREYLSDSNIRSPTAADLHTTGSDLAERVRKYQAASRQFILDWLRDTRRATWLVDLASGRTLDTRTPRARPGSTLGAATQIVLAEDQPLHGLRTRFVRSGIGIPITVCTRRHGSNDVVDVTRSTASRPMTAVVVVDPESNEQVRTVRVRLFDPTTALTVALGGATLPLAADFTAPVAHTLGMERKPAGSAYGIRDAARRGTVDGFTALTPYAPNRAPLVLLDGAGFSPLMMAQIANEVAADRDLGRRFQAWLYQYPMVSPLFYAASRFRADLDRLCSRLDLARGRPPTARAVVVAQGPGAVLAKSLLIDSGPVLWDAAFRAAPGALELAPADRALLESLLFWRRSERIDRVIVAGESGNAESLTRGVGDRAVQLLLRQPTEFRAAVERIYWGQKQHLRRRSGTVSAAVPDRGADGSTFPEPVCQALSDAAAVCEQALVSMLTVRAATGRDVAVFAAAGGLVPLQSQAPSAALGTLGPQSVRLIVEALRPRH
jgi:hypothetical protein